MDRPQHSTRKRSLLGWALVQMGLFALLLVQLLGVGIIDAILTRRFHWRGFLAGFAVMLLGVAAVSFFVFIDGPPVYGARELALWGGAMLVMTLGGFVTGRVGRRAGFWESELATLAVAALFYVHLAVGLHDVAHLGGDGARTIVELMGGGNPGQRYLGLMWDRTLILAAVAGFLLAVFGGSLAFLFFSDEGRFDAGFDFEAVIGTRHLRSHRPGLASITAIVAVIGVALGVASLVAVTAVMSGYQQDIQSKILSTNAHFVIQKYGIDFTEYAKIADEAAEIDGVLAATPFTFNEAMLATGERGIGVLLKGVVPQRAGEVTGIEENLCRELDRRGRCRHYETGTGPHLPELLAAKGNLPSLVVGAALLKKIGLPIGAPVTLTTPIGIAGARGNAPKRMEFRIGGAFRSGMHDFDARLIYMDLEASQRLMGLGSSVSGVELKVRDPERVEAVAAKVYRAIGKYPYRLTDWRKLNEGIFMALKLQKIVMFLVLSFIIVVAAFNIASSLFMAVVEKAREIAVLKSMGARDSSIMKVFVLEGWLVGGAGTLLGVALGLLVCAILGEAQLSIAADVYMVESLHVRVQPFEVGVTAAATLIISHLATVYPALKAARQRPVDAMRYD